MQGTVDHGLMLRKAKQLSMVLAYSDADWAGYSASSHSTIGCAIFLGPNLVSWHSKKQPTVSKSLTKAEYRAIAYTVTETLWIRYVLAELGIVFRSTGRFSMITSLQRIFLPILYFMIVANISKWIIILFMNESLMVT